MRGATPPRLPALLLRWILPDSVVGEAIRGDLAEEYRERRSAARRWYWRQALSVCVHSLAGRFVPLDRVRPVRAPRSSTFRVRPEKGEDEMMGNFASDLRFGLRGFVKRPAMTVTALVTLTLGIGANAAIFSVVHGVLLRPLPYEDPDGLVAVSRLDLRDGSHGWLSVPNFDDWRRLSRSFSGMSALESTTAIVTDGPGGAEQLTVAIVTHDFFEVLGVPLLHGRSFLPEEETAEMTRAVILAEEVWRRRYGADPGVVGRRIDLEGDAHEVVGIAPEGLRTPFIEEARMWLPYGAYLDCGRACRRLDAVARLRDGVGLEQAREDLGAIAAALREEHPEDNADKGAFVVPLYEEVVGEVRPALLLLSGAVGFVLLLACANVAHLFLVRATSRQPEIAIRTALGASRGRLVRQLLTESTALGLGAGVLGVVVAQLAMPVLLRLAPAGVPRLDQVHLGAPVLLFTLTLALATGVVFGLIPACRGTRSQLSESLPDSRGAAESGRRGRLRDALMVAEVAVTLTLLVAAGLLVKSFAELRRVDSGIRAEGVLTAHVSPPSSPYGAEERVVLYDRLLERIRGLPGVESAAATWALPVSPGGQWVSTVSVEGRPDPPPGYSPAVVRPVTPGYFETLGIPLLSGRDFTAHDDWESPQVAVVSAKMARELFADEPVLGRRLELGMSHRKTRMYEIVGVVGDAKISSLAGGDDWTWYIPYGQARFGAMDLALRTSLEPLALAEPLRKAVAEVAPDVVLQRVRTMSDVVAASIAPQRFNTLLLAVFAVLAVLLAAVGIYGVVAFAVSQRTRELGIRLSLGARPADLVRRVVGRGLALTAAGVALGTAGAVALSRVLESLLFGVDPGDPAVFAGVVVLTLAVAVAASYLPAHRAGRTDPVAVLRAE